MAAKTISLQFKGYRRDKNRDGIPDESGIYLVYTCTYNPEPDTVTLHRLIYIGESAEVGKRIRNHPLRPTWQKYLGQGEELCYSFALVANPDRERGEAALIFYKKPPVNEEYKDSFPYDQTTMKCTGMCEFIPASFTVERTE